MVGWIIDYYVIKTCHIDFAAIEVSRIKWGSVELIVFYPRYIEPSLDAETVPANFTFCVDAETENDILVPWSTWYSKVTV